MKVLDDKKRRIKEKIGEKNVYKLKSALKVARVIKNIVCWAIVAVLVFTVITFLLTRISGGTPSVFGYTLHRVETGSMEPALHVGDVILNRDVSNPEELKVGDIVTFQGGSAFGNRHVTHRVFIAPYKNGQGETVIVTKGDANEITDGEILLSKVESKMQQKVEFLRMLYAFFFSPWGLIIFIALMILIFFDEVMNIIHISTGKYDEKEKEESIGEIIERIRQEDKEKKKRNNKQIIASGDDDNEKQ